MSAKKNTGTVVTNPDLDGLLRGTVRVRSTVEDIPQRPSIHIVGGDDRDDDCNVRVVEAS